MKHNDSISLNNSRKTTKYKREYYLPRPSTAEQGKQIANARAKKIFILMYCVDRLFK